MSKSYSKKRLQHKLRNGQKIDPRVHRGSWNGIRPVVRVKENKKKDDEYETEY